MIQTLQHSQLGSIELVGPPAVKVEGFEAEPMAPPTLGQDTKNSFNRTFKQDT